MAAKEKNPPAPEPGTAVTRSSGLMASMAERYGVDPEKMNETLKQTAFRQRGKDGAAGVPVTNEQMMALLVVAKQYNLNPFTREIYAFPAEGGIAPIVGVDGWIRMINERPELESIEFEYADDEAAESWIACTIVRKDRSKPIKIREYLTECARETGPWLSHPRRMLRHKALIQCARIAFGFGGIYDPDEEERFRDAIDVTPARTAATPGAPKNMKPRTITPEALPAITLDQATMLADKLKEEGVDLSLLLAQYALGSLEDLPADKFDHAMKKIDELSAS
jgi:phage recombination protein Bet